MPFIKIHTNVNLPLSSQEKIKAELGQAITLIKGKSEYYLMIEILDNLKMYFQGNNSSCAMVEILIYGTVNNQDADKLTKQVTEILSPYVEKNRIYCSYFHTDQWGLKGENF